jgi:hypothetical protein
MMIMLGFSAACADRHSTVITNVENRIESVFSILVIR